MNIIYIMIVESLAIYIFDSIGLAQVVGPSSEWAVDGMVQNIFSFIYHNSDPTI